MTIQAQSSSYLPSETDQHRRRQNMASRLGTETVPVQNISTHPADYQTTYFQVRSLQQKEHERAKGSRRQLTRGVYYLVSTIDTNPPTGNLLDLPSIETG